MQNGGYFRSKDFINFEKQQFPQAQRCDMSVKAQRIGVRDKERSMRFKIQNIRSHRFFFAFADIWGIGDDDFVLVIGGVGFVIFYVEIENIRRMETDIHNAADGIFLGNPNGILRKINACYLPCRVGRLQSNGNTSGTGTDIKDAEV